MIETLPLIVMMEMLALNPTLANLELALDLIKSSALPSINVTMLELATLQLVSAPTPTRLTILLAVTTTNVL